MSSRKLAHFAVAFLVVVALSAALAASAFAEPSQTVPCSSCHSGAGTAPTVTLVSNNGTTATYSVQQVLSAWAAFDGTTRIAGDETSGGTFSGPATDTFNVFAVGDYPGPIGETTVTPGTSSPSPTPTPTQSSTPTPTPTPTPTSTSTSTPMPNFTITPSAQGHGTISPSVPWSVTSGGSIIFSIFPARGCHIATLLVDGAPALVSSGAYYTFTNVTANHTIAVTFANTVATLSNLKLSGLSGTVLTFGKTLTATGSLMPANLGGAVILTVQREVNGKWLAVTSAARTLTASGTYSWTYKPATKGTYRIKTTFAAVAAHTAATTMWTVFSVK